MVQRARRSGRSRREQILNKIGRDVPRFQDATYAFDEVGAAILALDRSDLPVMQALLFGGPAAVEELCAALHCNRARITVTVERLQAAGYARIQPGPARRIELSAHAREWIQRIWEPLREDGLRLMRRYSTPQLHVIARFLEHGCRAQELRAETLRRWLSVPASPARRPHLRGGLSPAALHRVQVFVEANLSAPLHLEQLAARAGLSAFHFARAFKTTAGTTPRAFIESRRLERAKRLLVETAEPIATIAAETGFVTQSRLTTVFRHHTGFTPAAYRRGHRP
jgi:AraC family transcriptional regulator